MITFGKPSTFDGVTSWPVIRDGEWVGEISRERPMRWHANGVNGLVRNAAAPHEWLADIEGVAVAIPDGATARQAKAAVILAVGAK